MPVSRSRRSRLSTLRRAFREACLVEVFMRVSVVNDSRDRFRRKNQLSAARPPSTVLRGIVRGKTEKGSRPPRKRSPPRERPGSRGGRWLPAVRQADSLPADGRERDRLRVGKLRRVAERVRRRGADELAARQGGAGDGEGERHTAIVPRRHGPPPEVQLALSRAGGVGDLVA